MKVAASRFGEGLAAGLIGCVGGEVIISRPARELAPFDRLELAVSFLVRSGSGFPRLRAVGLHLIEAQPAVGRYLARYVSRHSGTRWPLASLRF
jgi:hypothetical protein